MPVSDVLGVGARVGLDGVGAGVVGTGVVGTGVGVVLDGVGGGAGVRVGVRVGDVAGLGLS
ncbi:MAG TPA: hypothetical protein VIP48_01605, partial [Streptosporangiaceae bacterium]